LLVIFINILTFSKTTLKHSYECGTFGENYIIFEALKETLLLKSSVYYKLVDIYYP